jgi:hypothetical protein
MNPDLDLKPGGGEMIGASVAFACAISACAVAWGQEAEYESFEDGVPACFAATRAESLSVGVWHRKQGKNSLRWDWRQGEELVIRHGIGDVARRGGIGNSQRTSFAVWVYMEKPISGTLVFEFREGKKVAGFFRFPLEFTGWRQGRPYYADLLRGKRAAKVDNLRIAAPNTVAKGEVFLDLIKYNTLTHGGRAIVPEKEAMWHRPIPDERRFPKPERVTEAERAGIRKLLGPDEGPGIDEARVKRLCEQVKALGIVRDEHGLRGGPSIDRHYQYCGRLGEHGAKESTYRPDEHGPGWLGIEIPARITSLAYQVAEAYRASRDAEQRRRLAEAFLLVEDHLYDQGMQAGAGFHWNWWVGTAWADAVFLMRDVLAEAGRLGRQCDYLLWNYGGEAIFSEAAPPSHMDYFQGLGHLEILAGGTPVGAKASGREGLGWDWRRFEGTTTPQLPFEELDKAWGSTNSTETFVGGLSHQGRQGIFAMIVNQPMAGRKTLKARKSWFFTDERILCLGSNISCDEAEYPTQTTLCQKRLGKNGKSAFLPTRLDGADVVVFPEERTLAEAKPHWFLDVQQTGYWLPAGQKITVARRHQRSREYSDLRDTEGDFLTAWIDHGKAPVAGSYEYMLIVRAAPEAIEGLAARPPYRVIQRDEAAHIVWDSVGRRWGCVLFAAQEVSPHSVATETLPIKAVDRPCLVMAEAVRDGLLEMSVADPDLNLEKVKGQPGAAAISARALRVTLHGAWRLREATGTVCAWQLPNASESVRILSTNATETVLEILCQHGASYGIRLAR